MPLLMRLQDLLDSTRRLDFLSPLLLRLFLAPIFILAGMNKLGNVEAAAWWFDSMASRPRPSWSTWQG